ncbi:MAG: DUF2066 domain-containing protein [Gammaproteobacteria bacterium]|nr:DUF2066 domain-containing protein [Gammaproteobacteria bacterium]
MQAPSHLQTTGQFHPVAPRRLSGTAALRGLTLALAVMLIPGGASAKLPNAASFYRVEVPVRDASTVSRNKAVLEAFEVMLQRVTGEIDPTSLAGWKSIRSNPSRYTAGLKYITRQLDQLSLFDKLKTAQYIGSVGESPADGTAPAEAASTQTTVLEVSFDRSSLEKLMENYAWTRWPAARPRVALWLFSRQGFREDLVPAASTPGGLMTEAEVAHYTQTLDYLYSRPGLEYVMPSAGWLERNGGLVAQVRAGRYEKAVQHLAREGYNEFVVIRMRPSDSSFFASVTRYKLSRKGESERSTWEAFGRTLEDSLHDGTQILFERMVADYVRDVGSLQDIDLHLEVSGVNTLEDYIRVLSYLTSMPQNVDVQVLRVSEQGVEFMLKIRGVWSDILRVYSAASIFEVARFEQPRKSIFEDDLLSDSIADSEAGTTVEGTYGSDSGTTGVDENNGKADNTGTSSRTDKANKADSDAEEIAPSTTSRKRAYRAKHYLHAVLRH